MQEQILPPLVQWVREIERRLGDAPRRPNWSEWSRFATPRPPWCPDSDPLSQVRRDKRRLLTTGEVKLAAVLRYDAVMEKRSAVHGTADVLYETDGDSSVMPSTLTEIRDRLLELASDPRLQVAKDLESPANESGRDAEQEAEQRFVDFFRTSNQRGFGVRTPASITGEHPTAVSTLILYRHFLPGAMLTRRLVPLIVAAEPPRIALPIPKSFWPGEMYNWWLAE